MFLKFLAPVFLGSLICVYSWAATTSSSLTQGIGIILGRPSGIVYSTQIDPKHELHAQLSWALGYAFGASAAYVWDFPHAFDEIFKRKTNLVPYVGIGGIAGLATFGHFNTYLGIGVDVPLGMQYQFDEAPVMLFLELAPAILIFPATDGTLLGGIGAKYMF